MKINKVESIDIITIILAPTRRARIIIYYVLLTHILVIRIFNCLIKDVIYIAHDSQRVQYLHKKF